MQHHKINGWNVYHEQKKHAPPIISIRICITRTKEHQQIGLSYLYLSILTQKLQQEAQKYPIAGDIYTSLSQTHFTIGIDTLDEDLLDFIVLAQRVLRQKISAKEIQEEQEQQKLLDIWNSKQPQALLQASKLEFYYGPSHPLGFDYDGTWREREAYTPQDFEAIAKQDWGASLFLVSAKPLDAYLDNLSKRLKTSIASHSYPYPPPQRNWLRRYVQCNDAKQVSIVIVRPAPPLNSITEYPTRLGLMTLSGLFHSRINQAIRKNAGASYGIESSYIATPSYGRIEWTCFVDPKQAKKMIDIIQYELNHAGGNWSKEEFSQALTIAVQEEKQREETCSQTADLRSYHLHKKGMFLSTEERCEKWTAVQYQHVEDAMNALAKSPELLLCVGEERFCKQLSFLAADTPSKYQF